MWFVRFLLAAGIIALSVAGVLLLDSERRADGADGVGHRIALETPSTMQLGECPDYRANAGAGYLWDTHAFADSLEAQLSHCGRVDTGPLGEWVVEERSDSRGNYSISAHLNARSHTVAHDWGGFAPSISLNCWSSDNDEERRESGAAESLLDVWLWRFGPPQRFYGEPTPVQYRFEGYQPTEVALWSGHSAQTRDWAASPVGRPEVTVLWPPAPGIVEHNADSRAFAARLRRAAAVNTDENSGPLLEFETWSGATTDASGASQGTIEFDLLGVERAAFPVLDACGV